MSAATTPVVELRDICVSFGGVRAVDRASIALYAGEVLALVGPWHWPTMSTPQRTSFSAAS